MKIAIVGGGWVGCHLAMKLKADHEITIFEKNKLLFSETSFSNQNRLHQGYHYSRNYKTRKLCEDTFDLFMKDYGEFTDTIYNNYYCIPENSVIDFRTYQQIFDHLENGQVDNPSELKNIEGSLWVAERYIKFYELQAIFNLQLASLVEHKEIKNLKTLAKDYDLVINATNNCLNQVKNTFYEMALTLVYEKTKKTTYDAITLVDGPFFSIYPYRDNCFSLTDVEYTPVAVLKTAKEVKSFKVDEEEIQNRIILMEEKVLKYYPKFKNDFNYLGFYISIKSKVNSASADRSPVMTKQDNIVNCFSGKIQGIYLIEDYIKEVIATDD